MQVGRYVLGINGTNTYLVWDEASKDAFVIDPAADSPELKQHIASEGLHLRYILLTHAHGDHIGGVPGMSESFPDAEVCIGAAETAILADAERNHSELFSGQRVAVAGARGLKDGDTLPFGETALAVIDTPGHTVGGVSYLVDGVLFSGDSLFQMSIGRTDLAGGDFDTLMRSIREKLFILPDETIVLPGHMDQTSIGYEKSYNPYC